METKTNLLELVDRSCDRIGFVLIANISVMGAAPTVIAFDSVDDLSEFVRCNPSVSVNLMTVPYYGLKKDN